MIKFFKNSVVFIIILILIIISFGIYYFEFKKIDSLDNEVADLRENNKELIQNNQNILKELESLKKELTIDASVNQPEYQNWKTYKTKQGHTFSYPAEYSVNEVDDQQIAGGSIIHIRTSEIESAIPSAQINVDENHVSFSLWEGIEWPDLNNVIKSFNFIK